MLKDLIKFSEKYEDYMFNSYTRVWDIGVKLTKHWKSRGIDTPNPFCVEDKILQNVELRQAMFILAPYWNVNPIKYFDTRNKIDHECVQIAYKVIEDYLICVNPRLIRVCLCTGEDNFTSDFDIVIVYKSADDIDRLLKDYSENDVWVEASWRLLRALGVRALNYTLYNPYSHEIITDVLFTADREYHEEFDSKLVVSWCSEVRQYTYHICDIRQNILNAHYTNFAHLTDEKFESAILEEAN